MKRPGRHTMAACIAAALVAVFGLVYATWTGAGGSAYWKMAASTGFLAVAVAAGGLRHAYGWAILVALGCSWFGDLFLISSQDRYFLLGLVAFLLGHLAYAAAFLIHGVGARGLAAGALVALATALPILRWLSPHLDAMRYPVYAYMLVISLMLIFACGTQARGGTGIILTGAVLFYLSDIFVARQRFVAPGQENALIGLPLYYAAQLMLAGSIASMDSRRHDRELVPEATQHTEP